MVYTDNSGEQTVDVWCTVGGCLVYCRWMSGVLSADVSDFPRWKVFHIEIQSSEEAIENKSIVMHTTVFRRVSRLK